MRYSHYKFKFYLNASHAIYIDGTLGQKHPHTWEITIHVLKERQEFIQFSKLENKIEAWIEQYQDTYLNEMEPFDTLNPTLENFCEYFKEKIKELLDPDGWNLLMVEVSETPTRSYIINLFEECEIDFTKGNSEVVAEEILDDIFYKLDGKWS